VTPQPDAWLRRIERDTLVVAGVLAAAALALWPGRPGRAAGVLGGLALIALSYRGIRAGVSQLWAPPAEEPPGPRPDAAGGLDVPPRPAGEEASGSPSDAGPEAAGRLPEGRPAAARGFVKFFTRHAILAAGAYVMMARFEFDPMAMLAGVTAPAIAAGVEVVRTVRARHGGSQSR
jgi:hypothetical protein